MTKLVPISGRDLCKIMKSSKLKHDSLLQLKRSLRDLKKGRVSRF